MKHNEVSRITNIIDSAQSSEEKIKSIKSFIKQLGGQDAHDLESSIEFSEIVMRKKITNSMYSQTLTIVDKTSKIRKNKKNKKKKPQQGYAPQLPTPAMLTDHNRICRACANATHSIANPSCIVHYDQDSQDEEQSFEEVFLGSIFDSESQELLTCYYEEMDKIVSRLVKDSEKHNSITFIRLMRQLAGIYEDFDLQIRQIVLRRIQAEYIETDNDEVIEDFFNTKPLMQFMNFALTEFPLLKDFIENFNLKELTQKQEQELLRLRSDSLLVNALCDHLIKIITKKLKKRHKRQQQKINRKLNNKSSSQNPNQRDLKQYEIVVNALQGMKISQNEHDRTICYFDEDWLQRTIQRLMIVEPQQ